MYTILGIIIIIELVIIAICLRKFKRLRLKTNLILTMLEDVLDLIQIDHQRILSCERVVNDILDFSSKKKSNKEKKYGK